MRGILEVFGEGGKWGLRVCFFIKKKRTYHKIIKIHYKFTIKYHKISQIILKITYII